MSQGLPRIAKPSYLTICEMKKDVTRELSPSDALELEAQMQIKFENYYEQALKDIAQPGPTNKQQQRRRYHRNKSKRHKRRYHRRRHQRKKQNPKTKK